MPQGAIGLIIPLICLGIHFVTGQGDACHITYLITVVVILSTVKLSVLPASAKGVRRRFYLILG